MKRALPLSLPFSLALTSLRSPFLFNPIPTREPVHRLVETELQLSAFAMVTMDMTKPSKQFPPCESLDVCSTQIFSSNAYIDQLLRVSYHLKKTLSNLWLGQKWKPSDIFQKAVKN